MKVTIEEIQRFELEMMEEVHAICSRNKIDYFLAYGSVIGAVRHQGPIPWDCDTDIVVPYNQFDKFVRIVRKELSPRFYLDYHDTNKTYQGVFPRIGLTGYSTYLLHIDVFKLVGITPDKTQQAKFLKRLRFYTHLTKAKQREKEYYRSRLDAVRMFIYKLVLLPISAETILKKYENLCSKYPYDQSEFVVNAAEGYLDKAVLPKSMYGEGVVKRYGGSTMRFPTQYEAYLQHFYGDYKQLPPESEREVPDFYEVSELK